MNSLMKAAGVVESNWQSLKMRCDVLFTFSLKSASTANHVRTLSNARIPHLENMLMATVHGYGHSCGKGHSNSSDISLQAHRKQCLTAASVPFVPLTAMPVEGLPGLGKKMRIRGGFSFSLQNNVVPGGLQVCAFVMSNVFGSLAFDNRVGQC